MCMHGVQLSLSIVFWQMCGCLVTTVGCVYYYYQMHGKQQVVNCFTVFYQANNKSYQVLYCLSDLMIMCKIIELEYFIFVVVH